MEIQAKTGTVILTWHCGFAGIHTPVYLKAFMDQLDYGHLIPLLCGQATGGCLVDCSSAWSVKYL